MKRKIAGILIPITLVLSVGCSSNEQKEVIENTSENTEAVRSSEEMYEIYESHIDEVKLLSQKYGVELEDISKEQTNYNNKTTALYKFYNEDVENDGDIQAFKYVAIVSDEGNIEEINAVIDMKVTNEEFKLEESKFNEFREIFTNEKIDYTEINEEINEAIQRGVDDNIINQYDEIEEDILIMSGNIVSYRLRIYP